MVHGIDKFREYFGDYKGQYVFIGGTACDIILGRMNIDFRATKDLDMVLIMEVLDKEFVERFIAFIEAGKYQHIDKGTGKEQFYRFRAPVNPEFPSMIELFSRRPDYLQDMDTRLAPIHVSDDVVSLSAILLDDDYYNILKRGTVEVAGVSVLDVEYLILFKMKAWLNLSERRESGEDVDSRNIKKHKNDVMRLAANLEPDKKLEVDGRVREDVLTFLGRISCEKFDMKALGIKESSLERILNRMKNCYGI